MRLLRTFALGSLLALPAPARAAVEAFDVAAGDDGSLVTFTSKAPMETFQGRTRDVGGTVVLARGEGADTVRVAAVVAMATLDTGIALRNRHMRENHLETDRFPEGRFEGVAVLPGDAAAGGTHDLMLRGMLTLHGVAREVEVAGALARDGAGIRLTASFPVALADHGISRPGFLAMKLGEVQRVEVLLVARPAPAQAPGTPADP